jgi:hypothetical protein
MMAATLETLFQGPNSSSPNMNADESSEYASPAQQSLFIYPTCYRNNRVGSPMRPQLHC